MHRRRRILLLAVVLGAAVLGAAYHMTTKVSAADPNARTLYTGSARVVDLSLAQAKATLLARGCRSLEAGGSAGGCLYQETKDGRGTLVGLEVHPDGLGFGPRSFSLTEGQVSATRDIPGPPDPEKFKREVRGQVQGFLTIDEASWVMAEVKYPWTVRY